MQVLHVVVDAQSESLIHNVFLVVICEDVPHLQLQCGGSPCGGGTVNLNNLKAPDI